MVIAPPTTNMCSVRSTLDVASEGLTDRGVMSVLRPASFIGARKLAPTEVPHRQLRGLFSMKKGHFHLALYGNQCAVNRSLAHTLAGFAYRLFYPDLHTRYLLIVFNTPPPPPPPPPPPKKKKKKKKKIE